MTSDFARIGGTDRPADATACLRATGLSSRMIDGELIVLDLDASRYLAVRGSGTLLFELLRTPRRVSDLVAALVDRFEVDERSAHRDVVGFLARLGEAGLLAS